MVLLFWLIGVKSRDFVDTETHGFVDTEPQYFVHSYQLPTELSSW